MVGESTSLIAVLREKAQEAEGNAVKCRREGDYELAQWYEGVARGFRDSMEEVLRHDPTGPFEAQLTAVLAETTRWQQEAQSPEERAWANVHHAAVTRAIKEVTP